ncbi:MAG: mechanosensitive ion channel [Desulfobacterales bacterium]|jgi:potassium efflux system protein
MKKTAALVTMISIWLIVFFIADIQAQQTAKPPSTAGSLPTLSVENLKNKRSEIENRTDIDAAVKSDSLKHIDEAIQHLELADGSNQQASEVSQLIQTAPARLETLLVQLKRPLSAPDNIAERAQQMDFQKLEQRLRQKEAELKRAQNRLLEWDARLAAEKEFIGQAAAQLSNANSRRKDVETELAGLETVTEKDSGVYFRKLSLASELKKLSAEIKLIKVRQNRHDLLVELFDTEGDVARKAVESRQKMVGIWQAEVQKRRQQEAFQAQEEAQDAILQTPLLPKDIREQFEINIRLSKELQDIAREEAALIEEQKDLQLRLKELEEDFATAQKRVQSAVLTETIGLALRAQRLNLPSGDQYLAGSEARKIRFSEINERQFKLDRLLRELAAPKALAERLIGSASHLTDEEHSALVSKMQELFGARIEIIEKLTSGYDRIFKLLQDIEFNKEQLVNVSAEFGQFLDRYLLWIRSSKRLSSSDLLNLRVALGWFFAPSSWREFMQDLGQSLRQRGAIWLVGLLIAAGLFYLKRWELRKLKDISQIVQHHPVQDSFQLTIGAFGLTALLAVVWPYVLLFPSAILSGLRDPQPFTAALISGLMEAGKALFVLNFIYHICRKNGLAQIHFHWPEPARQVLIHNFSWFIPIIAVGTFLFEAMESVPEMEYSDALAKFALIGQGAVAALFYARILRFKGGITSVLIQKYPKSWLSRLRYVWYPLVVAIPLVNMGLTVQGYHYSAMEIRFMIGWSIALVFAVIVFNDLALRWLMLTRRKIALKKARMAHQQQKEKLSADDPASIFAATADHQASLMESAMAMSAIDEQTRTLLKMMLFIFSLAGFWLIWAPVFPALGIFQDVELWSYTRVVDGTSQTVPITLANLVMSVIVIVVTIVAVRNLPGLFEMILLNRLPMNPGARYAYSTITRYALTTIGIVIALNAMGLRWSNLQWLVAALGVGLGFGLQEIVANFVSGLIVLFERPFSVGDTVTVGDIHGTVTRVQIRATTILDWDRKELIVPNKEFITGRLINWSLSDSIIRFKIPVGIAYGSDTDLAEQLLLKAAEESPLVLKTPAPQAVFLSFGDNSLNFELRVFVNRIDDWIPMLHAMNVAIDKEFRQAGITIAFPQRDVHLDASSPLEVRVVSEPSGSKSAKRSSAAPKDANN